MKRLLVVCALVFTCGAAMAQSGTPDLLAMSSVDVALYVESHTHALGSSFGDANILCGPFVNKATTTGDTMVQLCAVMDSHDRSAQIRAGVHVEYHENLWNMYRSAVLDDNTPLTIASDDKDFSDCDDDGCTYTETLVIAMPSSAFSKDRVGHKVGIRLYGDRHPTTVWLPSGYVGGFFTATTERQPAKQ